MRYLVLLAVLVACHRPTPSVAPIPATVPSLLGPVLVYWADTLTNAQGEALMGATQYVERRIFLSSALQRNLITAHAVLGHEICHLRLFDSGMRNLLHPSVAETLCDLFGHEWARLAAVPKPPED